jgi:chemotaxis methyl-accepting protein methylase
VLKQEILPGLLADQGPGQVFRVWVAGCASGEEAYSLAIMLRELMDERGEEYRVQIYATDLDDEAILQARRGRYPANIVQDLSASRLQRFFSQDGDGYKVSPVIRQMVIFSVHNVITAPPLPRLDLLSCRNLMIYLEPEPQARLIARFHYALKPGGVLVLSTSEGIASDAAHGESGELFSVLDRSCSLYRARAAAIVPRGPAFWALPARELAATPPGHSVAQVRFTQEKREWDYAWDTLEAVIRAQKSSNAELESANIESRSTSEERLFANQELQSKNSEVIVENFRLKARVDQSTGVQAALGELLDRLGAGVLILDSKLNIVFYNQALLAIYPLIAADVGRPLPYFKSNLADDRLLADLLAGLTGERPVQTVDGVGYVARIDACAAVGDGAAGLALTFTAEVSR